MAPKKSKPSNFLKKCSIAVVGGLGKNASAAHIEKWTVNNGGAFKSCPDATTTHIICSWETYRKDDFALAKKYLDNKKISLVEWAWLDDSLQSKHVKSVKRYLHLCKWNVKAQKKNLRRQALLTGKTEKEVERKQVEEKFGPATSSVLSGTEEHYDVQDDEDDLETADNTILECGTNTADGETQDSTTAYELHKDASGVYDVFLEGAQLLDPENGDYVLSVMVNKESKLYKACYSYVEEKEKLIECNLATTNNVGIAISAFDGFLTNKTGQTWSAYCAKMRLQQDSGKK